jgi:hypothetical protein
LYKRGYLTKCTKSNIIATLSIPQKSMSNPGKKEYIDNDDVIRTADDMLPRDPNAMLRVAASTRNKLQAALYTAEEQATARSTAEQAQEERREVMDYENDGFADPNDYR